MIDGLIQVAARSGAQIVHAGVAGIEDAAAVLPYYRAKLACEQRLSTSDVAHTICRATQFHPFVDDILDRLGWRPIQLHPPLWLQPVDPRFVAERLVDHALAGAQGRAADVHGPERLDAAALIAPWLQARGRRRIAVPVPAVAALSAFRRLREVRGEVGGRSWTQWLSANVGAPEGSPSNGVRPR